MQSTIVDYMYILLYLFASAYTYTHTHICHCREENILDSALGFYVKYLGTVRQPRPDMYL